MSGRTTEKKISYDKNLQEFKIINLNVYTIYHCDISHNY